MIGFHTYDYSRHFMSSVLWVLGIHMREGIAEMDGQRARVATFPIGIDVDAWQELARTPETQANVDRMRSLFRNRKIVLGVERLDYTRPGDSPVAIQINQCISQVRRHLDYVRLASLRTA